MIELIHLRRLLAVTLHKTVQAAAEALHVTQPALTKSIARFEEQLGVKLFDRRGHKLVLTEMGERLVERSQDLMRHVRDLEEEVDLWKGIGIGEVEIGVDPEAELTLLLEVLEEFVPAYPRVQITVRSGTTESLLPQLLRGELHFLVADAELALERGDLEILRLAADPLAAALRPDHPLSKNLKPGPADLELYPIAGAPTAPRFERWSDARAREEGVEPIRPSLRCDNYEVLVRLAESSDTIIFGARAVLTSYAQTGRLEVMDWPLEGPDSSPSLIRSKGRHLSPAAEQLMLLFQNSRAN